jgi:geranylgeranylglycerol-phosphate geranylgeranyltransferase
MGARIDLSRPNICILSVLGLIVGLKFTNIPLNLWILPILSVFALCASGNVINDYFDRKIDQVNKPSRPIPSGKITPGECFWLYGALTSVGLLAAYFVSQNFFMLSVFNAILVYLYSLKFKKNAFGNLLDTYLAVSVFIAPVFIFGGPFDLLASTVIYLVPIPFFVNYGREILKAVEDVKGDRKAKARTLPIVIGKQRAVLFGKLMIFLGALCLFLPYAFGVFGDAYFIFALAVFVVSLFALGLDNVTKLQKITKALMFLVMAVFLVY